MKKQGDFYSSYQNDMILRDYLAADRTVLANERTLLSYFRTCLGLIATGGGLVKLFEEPYLIYLGIVLLSVSPFVLIIGIYRFIQMKKKLKALNDDDGGDDTGEDTKDSISQEK